MNYKEARKKYFESCVCYENVIDKLSNLIHLSKKEKNISDKFKEMHECHSIIISNVFKNILNFNDNFEDLSKKLLDARNRLAHQAGSDEVKEKYFESLNFMKDNHNKFIKLLRILDFFWVHIRPSVGEIDNIGEVLAETVVFFVWSANFLNYSMKNAEVRNAEMREGGWCVIIVPLDENEFKKYKKSFYNVFKLTIL